MRKLLMAVMALLTAAVSFAQINYKVTWGEEMKLKKGTADIDIVTADNTGVYFAEGHVKMKSYFVIGATYGTAYKLYKFDKSFAEVWDKEYKKELKGLDFHSFQPIGDDLFIFATDYIKKERTFKVFGAKIDKNSGDLVGEMTELGSYELESKKDDFEVKFEQINGGKNILMVSDISNKDRNTLGVTILDNKFKVKENAVVNLTYEKNHFALQDVKYTASGKIVILGKEFEDVPYGRKKKKTKIVFKHYVMSTYTNKGKKEKEIEIGKDSKYIISGKLIEQATGELLLAGFYSNEYKKDNLNGFFISKVDAVNGTLLLSSFKEINESMLGKPIDDDSEDDDELKESKKAASKAKDDDDEDEFPNSFTIKSVDVSPLDGSYIITAEISEYRRYTYTSSSRSGGVWQTTTTTVHQFRNKDILVIDSDKDGKIKWLNAIPKSQYEEVRSSNSSGMGLSFYTDFSGFFAKGGGMPYYSSYTTLLNDKNQLIMIMNDHTSNNAVANYGDKVKTVSNFKKKSNVYGLSIDLATGKINKKFIVGNDEELIMMPRHAFIVKNEIYIPSWKMRTLAKTQFKIAKIQVTAK
jgi:hypothetical protein